MDGKGRGKLTVRTGYSTADSRATLLHEMAHFAPWRYDGEKPHDWKWRRVYLEACVQATGIYPLVGRKQSIDLVVRRCFERGFWR
jgi:hypothetical protein